MFFFKESSLFKLSSISFICRDKDTQKFIEPTTDNSSNLRVDSKLDCKKKMQVIIHNL